MTPTAEIVRRLREWITVRVSGRWPTRSMDDDLLATIEHLEALSANIDACDQGHRFAPLPDHPRKDGMTRCPHCMASGIDAARSAPADGGGAG